MGANPFKTQIVTQTLTKSSCSDMKEIIYIQAGKFANHIGTHFWNAQQSYFTYGADAQDPIVNHDVSFREGENLRGESTFSPRLLLFDRKSNFGRVADLYGPDAEANDEVIAPWDGDVVEYRQEPIPDSKFHAELEAQAEEASPPADMSVGEERFRYWSDYSMVYYHPRSLQRLPDPPDWEDSEGEWGSGGEIFERQDEDTDFMEDAFRAFVEECDNLQGIQITHDTASFGSFTNVFATKLRDEFVKLPCMTFPCMSPNVPGRIDVDNLRGIKLALNDALVIQGLCELATIVVPIQSPTTWSMGEWRSDLDLPTDDLYHPSALLSTHIESATLPFRLKGSSDDMSSITSILNWRGHNRLAYLNGILPVSTAMLFENDIEKRIFDFSKPLSDEMGPIDPRMTFARSDVSRGLSPETIKSYDQWAQQFQPLPHSVHAPIIELPASFPLILKPPTPTVAVISSIQTTSLSSSTFKAYGSLASECLTKYPDVIARMGVEPDEIKELKESMWTLEDAYKNDDDWTTSDDVMGEDEEF